MHPRLQAATKEPSEMSAGRFFNEICPAVMSARKDALAALGGRYAFVIRGEGAWLIDFGQAAVEKVSGRRLEVDLTIEMDADAFSRLMKGNLDVRRALEDGRVGVAGDARLFSNLSAAFRPAA